jgi:hypothetical protein
MGNEAFRNTNLGSPPVTGTDAYLLSVDGVPIHPAKLSAAFQTVQERFRERHAEARRLKVL